MAVVHRIQDGDAVKARLAFMRGRISASVKLLATPTPDTFLGRKTQEPFPKQESENGLMSNVPPSIQQLSPAGADASVGTMSVKQKGRKRIVLDLPDADAALRKAREMADATGRAVIVRDDRSRVLGAIPRATRH
ncbi:MULTISPECIES: hypothetical protein [Bradyrhizobium]|jgi:hypothetical protein|uniref:hypothetical protein n=1 Tax=Bradyrhizobium TaxID=374 RepID=UPI0004808D01|nr:MULTISPECIES: hypothetical protein [Bradyrhizobium]MCS3447415.1 hypothetical protein [Bradyrhizobium elkanii]MCS3561446.1 hypothetical protein [Bradyrhizobium elkanii]MCW2148711.1 hypothetical protein [Bradyrhizobium elkanii]MCW2352201.1 hypothetical protein [Bradyrhizobium elkanii]MCW2372440.1 hypothetical protein [Bradyrhizobium elkanii]